MPNSYQRAKATCHHEASHIVCAMTRRIPIARVAIAPHCDANLAGVATYAAAGDDFDMIVAALGGGIAERKFTGIQNEDGVAGDREDIVGILTMRYGREISSLDAPIVAAAGREAEKIVEQRWPEIQALAAELVKRFEIKETEIREIVAKAATERLTREIEQLEKAI